MTERKRFTISVLMGAMILTIGITVLGCANEKSPSSSTISPGSGNQAPSVTVTTPSGTQRGNVAITYNLIDDDSDPCSIAVLFSVDGGSTYKAATMGPGGDGITSLTSSPKPGTVHTYIWDSMADIGPNKEDRVRIHVTPSDTVAGTPAATGDFTVDNRVPNSLPFVLIERFTQVQSGSVPVKYYACDGDQDPVDIVVEYSSDGGQTFHRATMGTGGDGIRNLSTKPTSSSSNVAGALHTYIWNSIADMGIKSQRSVQIRITPFDPQQGKSDTTPSFGVDNTAIQFGTKVALDRYYYTYASSTQNPATATATLEVFNHNRITAEFWFGSSQRFDFIVRDAAGNEVYRWSRGKAFLQVVGIERIAGGQKLLYVIRIPLIDQRSNGIAPLRPGRYTLEGILTSRRPMKGIVTFEILRGPAPNPTKSTTKTTSSSSAGSSTTAANTGPAKATAASGSTGTASRSTSKAANASNAAKAAAQPSPPARRPLDYFGVMVSCDKPLYYNNLMPPVRDPAPDMTASLTVFNFRPNPVEFTLLGYGFDFVIRDLRGREIWRWTYGRPIPPAIIKRHLSNDKLTWTVRFKVTDNNKRILKPGHYILEAYTTSQKRMLGWATFELKNVY
jgi:hypothetical protein